MKNDITCIFLTPTPTHSADKHCKFQLGEVGHLRVDLKGQFPKRAILEVGEKRTIKHLGCVVCLMLIQNDFAWHLK